MSEFGFQTASPPNGGAIVPGVTPIIGGAVGQILFQGAGNVIQESSSLFWNNAATSLNVIGTNPSVTLNSTSSLTNFSQGFGFSKNGVGIFSFGYTESVSTPRFFIYAATTDRDAIKIYNSTANVAIGNAPSQNTDAGFRLDVNGTARVQGNTSIIGNVGVRATIPSPLSSDLVYLFAGLSTQLQGTLNTAETALNNNIYWDGTNLRRQTTGFCQSLYFDTSGDFQYNNAVSGAGGTIPTSNTRMVIKNNGNVLINTTTDAGFKFDVNGTARVQDRLTLGTSVANGQIQCGLTTLEFRGALTTNVFTFRQINSGAFAPSALDQSLVNLAINQAESTNNPNRGSVISISGTINNTGVNSYVYRGIYYNPTITSLTNTQHYAFHSTSGWIRFENLPTSSAGLPPGTLYNNLGVLTIA